ncbi:MAG: Bax inhibitor-1/YccA family protein [Alphaproteobacteria bacterium]|nr:Bax inhibitor-1/YccA family protein [Alphaproteobacteria bacterium]
MFDIKNFSHAASVDQGLRAHMLRVYNYMTTALLVSGLLAYLGVTFEPLASLLFRRTPMGIAPSGFSWVLFFVQIGIAFYFSARIASMSFARAQGLFWAFAAAMGLGMAPIVAGYTGMSIARVFLVTSAMFGSMSLYGYITKKDLTSMGSFAYMALIGIVLASVVNIFLQSGMMYFIISCIGVVVFTLLTAYDTQRIRGLYYAGDMSDETQKKKAIFGALTLYLDFVNLFLMLLHFLGDRK